MSEETHAEAVERRRLHPDQVAHVAAELRLEPALVWAVTDVEASGGGFLPDGRPKVLFEAAWFWERLEKRGFNVQYVQAQHPNICAPRWDRSLYAGSGVGEWSRLLAARAIHEEAADESASWGLFQIMGFHYARCGFPSAKAFAAAMGRDEAAHLEAFGRWIKADSRLLNALRDHRWAAFAYGYNGEAYRQNEYDTKIAAAFLRRRGATR